MRKRFHNGAFDSATLLKLEIFRGYVREWFPVFLSRRSYRQVHIYDFFAGPGTDEAGQPGTPLIITDELEQFLRSQEAPLDRDLRIALHFNDLDGDNVARLATALSKRRASLPYEVETTRKPFAMAFSDALRSLQDPGTANLVLIDQCGIKEVNEHVFKALIQCPATDILFFIASSYIRRFISEGCIRQYFPVDEEQIRAVSPKEVHRYICREFYRKLIPQGQEYYVAPFSIEKEGGSNVYGVVFGSGSLFGLDKFLRICWSKDKVTGEANYNIDNDAARNGQTSFLPEDNVIKKQDRFAHEIETFLRRQERDNRAVYRFSLENGFLPKHANEILRNLQKQSILSVADLQTGGPAHKGAFYLNWDNYNSGRPHVRFRMEGSPHGAQPNRVD